MKSIENCSNGRALNLTNQAIIRAAPGGEWLHFQNLEAVIETYRVEEVRTKLDQIEALVAARRWYAVGFLSYEAAPAFDPAFEVLPSNDFPLLWFGLYKRPEPFSSFHSPGISNSPCNEWYPSIDQAAYDRAFEKIKRHLAIGDTYQVNYTFRLRSPFSGSPFGLFANLVCTQAGSYAAYLDTGRYAICSGSPELFFRLDGRRLITRPMKGTTPRGRFWAEDVARVQALRRSEKNRAENAMIVDMLRNDLGRIANPGSVRVVRPFAVEPYPTLWQMTSTVEAETNVGLGEILTALFPCGSVTGAPKVNTMKIIANLEMEPRKIYTGALGFLAPGRRAQFNVAIRTVLVDRREGLAEYGVGSGIVWDSTNGDEYNECRLKAGVLTERRPDFSLLETLLWRPGRGYFLLSRHLKRLRRSVAYFSFPVQIEWAREKLLALASSLPQAAHKVRVLAAADGTITCEAVPLPVNLPSLPVRLRLAPRSVNSADPFLYHKTTFRQIYDAARSECADGDDVLLWNERGEVTESCFASVVVELPNGEHVTPPVASGLLPGTFREWLLERGEARERVVTVQLLKQSRRIYLVNSVRGWQEAALLWENAASIQTASLGQAETQASGRR